MAVSQNGWVVIHQGNDPNMVVLGLVTGRVRAGDVATVLGYVAEEFDRLVEPVRRDWSWGYAPRPIRGSTVISNHASGTAIDLNAPLHPLGRSGTFTARQVALIRGILAVVSPAVRWGGDYSGRKDEMHFEINASAALVAYAARRVRELAAGVKPPPALITDPPVVVIPTPTPIIPATPEESSNMNPFILVRPDSAWFLVTAGSPRPVATQIGRDTANSTASGLSALPIYRVQDAGTWNRLTKALEMNAA